MNADTQLRNTLTNSYLLSSPEIKLFKFRESVLFASTFVRFPTRYSRCLLAIWRKFVTRICSAGDSNARNIWNENKFEKKIIIKWIFIDYRLPTVECNCLFNCKWFKILNHQKIHFWKSFQRNWNILMILFHNDEQNQQALAQWMPKIGF